MRLSEIDYEAPLGIVGAVADKLLLAREVQRAIDQSGENFAIQSAGGVLQPV